MEAYYEPRPKTINLTELIILPPLADGSLPAVNLELSQAVTEESYLPPILGRVYRGLIAAAKSD